MFLTYFEETLSKAAIRLRYPARSTSLNVEILIGLILMLLYALLFVFSGTSS